MIHLNYLHTLGKAVVTPKAIVEKATKERKERNGERATYSAEDKINYLLKCKEFIEEDLSTTLHRCDTNLELPKGTSSTFAQYLVKGKLDGAPSALVSYFEERKADSRRRAGKARQVQEKRRALA